MTLRFQCGHEVCQRIRSAHLSLLSPSLFFSSPASLQISIELSLVTPASSAKKIELCSFVSLSIIIVASSNIFTRSSFFNSTLLSTLYVVAGRQLSLHSSIVSCSLALTNCQLHFLCLAIDIALALNLIPFYFQYQQSNVCFNSSNKRSGSLVIAATTRIQPGPTSILRQLTCSSTLILRFTVLADTDQQPSTSNPSYTLPFFTIYKQYNH